MRSFRASRGTTLVEAIVAIGILAVAVVALVGLSSIAVRTAMLARARSLATLFAVQKTETVCRDGAAALESPADAWAADTPGYVEYLDARGNPLSGRNGAVYVRRWSVTPLASDADLLAIQVMVSPCRAQPGAAQCGDSSASARLACVRSRFTW